LRAAADPGYIVFMQQAILVCGTLSLALLALALQLRSRLLLRLAR
jgi:hypothetical protein